MGDIIDKAQQNEELFRNNALRKHFAGRSPSPVKGKGVKARKCIGCGEPIPEKRLKANPAARRCIDCQELVEKNGERFLAND
jgi:DnaK suppressor protein